MSQFEYYRQFEESDYYELLAYQKELEEAEERETQEQLEDLLFGISDEELKTA